MFAMRIILLTILLAVVGLKPSFAESPYKALLTGEIKQLLQTGKEMIANPLFSQRWKRLSVPLSLQARLNGRGILTFSLTNFRRSELPSDDSSADKQAIVFIRGITVQQGSRRTRLVTGSLYKVNDNLHLNLIFRPGSRHNSPGRGYMLISEISQFKKDIKARHMDKLSATSTRIEACRRLWTKKETLTCRCGSVR
jgi:hypothetical protein